MTIEWRKSSMGYSSRVEWAKPLRGDEYEVYEWKDGWAFSRPAHPILGELSGQVSSSDEAQAICERDYASQQRLRRWNQYMLDNEPPIGAPNART